MPRSISSLVSRTSRNGSDFGSAAPGGAVGADRGSSALMPPFYRIAAPRPCGYLRDPRSGNGDWTARPRKGASISGRRGRRERTAAEIDDRVVEPPQRAVMPDADDRRPPFGFAQHAV